MNMNGLSDQFGTFAVTALLVYLVLRAVGSRREGHQLALARRHAWWCAVIAFFASSSSSWFSTFYEIPNEPFNEYSLTAALGTAATPAAWILFVYVAGQFTWPRKLKPQRSASLQPRTVTGLIPRTLLALLVAAFSAAGIALWAVRDVTGLPPQRERIIEGEDYWAQVPDQPGIRAAADSTPMVLACLGLLLMVTVIVTILVIYRKPLPGISDHDNRLLRRTWLNRLYRTVIVVVVSTAGELLHYKARWFSRISDGFMTDTGYDRDSSEYFTSLVGTWDSVANYAVTGVAVLMLFWRPPGNFNGLPAVRTNPVARLRDQLYSVNFVTAAITLALLSAFYAWAASVEQTQSYPTPERGEKIMLLLALAALFYLASNAAVMAYVSYRSRGVAALPRHSGPLPKWCYAVAIVLVLGSVYVTLNPPLDYLWGLAPARPLVPLALVLLLVLGFTGLACFARRMVLPWDVSADMETWYRKVLELRALRAVTAAIIAMPLMGYPFPDGVGVFALVVFLLPSALFLERPALHAASAVPAGPRQ